MNEFVCLGLVTGGLLWTNVCYRVMLKARDLPSKTPLLISSIALMAGLATTVVGLAGACERLG